MKVMVLFRTVHVVHFAVRLFREDSRKAHQTDLPSVCCQSSLHIKRVKTIIEYHDVTFVRRMTIPVHPRIPERWTLENHLLVRLRWCMPFIQCSISCDLGGRAPLLFLPEVPLEVDEVLGFEPDFNAALDDQGDELVCSLGSFIGR